MWMRMLVVDVRIVFVGVDHRVMAMPVRMLGGRRRTVTMNV